MLSPTRVVPVIHFEAPANVETDTANHGEQLLDLLEREVSDTKDNPYAWLQNVRAVLGALEPLTTQPSHQEAEELLEVFTFHSMSQTTR
jgi:hypothetical protein